MKNQAEDVYFCRLYDIRPGNGVGHQSLHRAMRLLKQNVLQVGCPSCRPTNSVDNVKAMVESAKCC